MSGVHVAMVSCMYGHKFDFINTKKLVNDSNENFG